MKLRLQAFQWLSFTLLIVFAAFAAKPLAAQREADVWYFGFRCGIDFREQPPVALWDGLMSVLEGSASFSDPLTGEFLFYTDGIRVWRRNGTAMPMSSTWLPQDRNQWPGSYSTTQPALVVPHPGRNDVYYIFNPGNHTSPLANNANALRLFYELSYSLIDMTKNEGTGEIIAHGALTPDLQMTEKISGTAVCGPEGLTYWVVTTELFSNAFYAFRIGADGVDPRPVISQIQPEGADIESLVGQMKISPDGRYIAVTNQRSVDAGVLICRFDKDNGLVTDPIYLTPPGMRGNNYGCSFSPNSRRLYISALNSDLMQLTLTEYNKAAILASAVQLPLPEGTSVGQMQLGPDGRIYLARPNGWQLGLINYPNLAGSDCEPGLHPLVVGGPAGILRLSRFGLPNFMDHIFNDAGDFCGLPWAEFSFDSVCLHQDVVFRDHSRRDPLQWHWHFEGGAPSEWEGPEPPPVRFETPGEYNVTLRVRNEAGEDNVSKTVVVPPPPAVDAGKDLYICPGDAQRLRAAGSGSFRWEPAAGLSAPDVADPIARPERTTEYIVTLRDDRGCENHDTVVVNVQAVPLRVSSTQTVCSGGSVRLAAEGALSYEWRPRDGLSDPTAPDPIARPQRSTLYTVTATNAFRCATTATVLVEVVDAPRADAGRDTSICLGDAVRLRGSGGTRYRWQPADGLSDPDSPTPLAHPRRSTRYTLRVDNGPDCSSTASVLITVLDTPILQLSGEQSICPGDSAQLEAGGGIRYEWEPSEGLNNPAIPNPKAAPERTTRYRVTAYNAAGCSTSATVRVAVGNFAPGGVRSSALTMCAGASVQLEAFGGDSYEWEPAEGLSAVDIPNPIAAPRRSQRYTLRLRRGDCMAVYRVDVTVVPRPVINLSADTRICAGESIRLEARGGIRFEWSPARGLSDPTSASPIAAPEETSVYTLRSWNEAGCVSSATVRVAVRPYLPAQLILPDVEGTPGEEVALPVSLSIPDDYLPVMIERLSLDLRYDARLLALRSVEGADMFTRRPEGTDEILSVELQNLVVQNPQRPILTLHARALIAQVSETAIRLDKLELAFAPGTCLVPDEQQAPGRFAIHSFCLGYNIGFVSRLQLQVQPNPARDLVSAQVLPARDGMLRLRLVNTLGRSVLQVGGSVSRSEAQRFDLVTAELPAGLYYLFAENGGQVMRVAVLLR